MWALTPSTCSLHTLIKQLLGAPRCSFRLLNVRQDVRFALVRNGLQFPAIAAWSEPVAVQQPNLPMQGHLSLTGVPG